MNSFSYRNIDRSLQKENTLVQKLPVMAYLYYPIDIMLQPLAAMVMIDWQTNFGLPYIMLITWTIAIVKISCPASCKFGINSIIWELLCNRLSIYRGYIWYDSKYSTSITMIQLWWDLHSRTTTHTSPLRASYGMSSASCTKKNDRSISRAHRIWCRGRNQPSTKMCTQIFTFRYSAVVVKTWKNNHIPHKLMDVIICPCPHSSFSILVNSTPQIGCQKAQWPCQMLSW